MLPDFTPQEEYEAMVEYACLKLYKRDWHGVCDAANDIRELLAAHPEIEEAG